MIPVVTPQEMRAIDAAAPESVGVLIERAGAALARAAVEMLGGTYGRRVVVVAGRGNNGADGRAAARRLVRRGVRVTVVPADAVPPVLPAGDLVIDAAYGTGFRGDWTSPDPNGAPVLAADIPSGVDGLTGAAGPGVRPADRTVTFAGLKPGLLFPPGLTLAGLVDVADIGLDTAAAATHLLERADVAAWLPSRPADSHKWRAALWVVAGSPGMLGAAHLASRAAQRAGAGMVRLTSPGVSSDTGVPTEVVGRAVPAALWSDDILSELGRFHALAIGPGLGRLDTTATSARDVVAKAAVPAVVDGDGLFALAWSSSGPGPIVRGRTAPTIVTPHDGEYRLLRGRPPGADRIAAARSLADELGSIVLLKGAATVITEPGGRTVIVHAGDARLATAGTGDVLTGIIAALLAQHVPPFEAAAAGAWIHGRAAMHGPARGLVAGDLPELIPVVLAELGQ
jgi:NAD(P)H-hydrate epimerase